MSYVPPKFIIGKKVIVSNSCDTRLCYVITSNTNREILYIHKSFIKEVNFENVDNNGNYSCYWCGSICKLISYKIKGEIILMNYCPKCLR